VLGHLKRLAIYREFAVELLVLAFLISPALAQTDDDNTRSVRIIEQPLSGAVPPPPVEADGAPPSPATSNAPSSEPGPASGQSQSDALPANVEVANPADLSLEVIPGREIALGSRVTLRIASKKPGYLILVDVDAAGKLTQIYPDSASLLVKSAGQNSNYVRPGRSIQIPSAAEAHAFELLASPPTGTSMLVAILSNRPVQVVDLPDVPVSMIGQASALRHLGKLVSDLRIPKGDEAGHLQEAHWSLAASFYRIR